MKDERNFVIMLVAIGILGLCIGVYEMEIRNKANLKRHQHETMHEHNIKHPHHELFKGDL